MYIYLCKYPNHTEGGYYYYIGKRVRTPESTKTYFGSGKFCKSYAKKYTKKYISKNVKKVVLMANIPNKKALSYWEQVHIRSYREQYGDKVVNWADGGEGGGGGHPHTEESRRKIGKANKGKKHPNYDHTIYHFRNVKTDETFKGTRHDFIKTYGLCKTSISLLMRGKIKYHKYWVLNDSEIKSTSCLKRIRSKAARRLL